MKRWHTRTVTPASGALFDATTIVDKDEWSAASVPTRETTRTYDTVASTITSLTGGGRQRVDTLDAHGRVTQSSVPGLAPVVTHYDSAGRVDSITQRTRGVQIAYDATTHAIASVTDTALNRAVTYNSPDALGRPATMTLPGSRTVGFTYDGRLLRTVTPPSRTAHDFETNLLGLLGVYTPPSVGQTPRATSYAYDNDGLLTSLVAAGQTMSMGYDVAGRAVARTLPATPATRYSYDAAGRLTSASGDVTLAYDYDGKLRRQVTATGAFSHTVQRTFDNFFRETGRTVDMASATAMSRGYDSDGLLTSVGGMIITRSPTNGMVTSTSVGNITETFTRDTQFGEVTDYEAKVISPAANLLTIHYYRDAGGRIHKKKETVRADPERITRYEYDAAGRLSEVYVDKLDTSTTPDVSYGYDSNGNRTTVNGVALGVYSTQDVAQDRLTSYGSTSFTYTNNGALATKVTSSQTTALTYDLLGQLRRYQPASGDPADFLIDGEGNRAGKKVSGLLKQGFLYSGGLGPVAEIDASGAVVATFGYGLHSNVPDVMIKGTTTYKILHDHLGSVRLVVRASDGAEMQRMDYDEWGMLAYELPSNPATPFQPFGFAGGLLDRNTGFVRFGARDYDPSVGRWTTKDTSRFGGGLNFYAYCYGDPINFIDVDGKNPILAVGIIAGGAVVGFLLDSYFLPRRDAETSGLPGPLNGPQDAYRHCLASCVTTGHFSSGIAKFCGDMNESESRSASSKMDFENNATGRSIGETIHGDTVNECRQQCYDAATNGGLITLPGYRP